MGRGRCLTRLAVAAQVAALAAALAGPATVAAATLGFTLQSPSVSSVAYSDMVTFRGTYTCVNDATSNCPTTSQTHTATFSLRPSGGSTFTTVGTVTTVFVFTSNPGGCATTCSVPFQLVWRSGRVGTTTIPPGVYDLGLTNTIGPGQPVILDGLTIVREGTTTTYLGQTSGQGGTALGLSASVIDHDRGLSPGTGIISPDVNLAGASVVSFELYDATNTTLVVGPTLANLTSGGATSGSPTLLLPSSGGTFQLRTTYAGNGFYLGSGDLDSITVSPSNSPPVLTVPAGPIVAEATSPAGAVATFAVSATDAEDDPDPTPTCDRASGDTFALGDTTVTCSVTDSGGLDDAGSFVVRVIDTTDPSVAVTTGEASGAGGWFNAAANDGTPGVTVYVSAADVVGVDAIACTDNGADVGPLDPAGDSFVVLDGQHLVDCLATDGAGNDASASAGFDVDQTPPTIVASTGPQPSESGWWNAATGAPTVTFQCSDAESGVASCSDPVAVGEGADQSASGTATDAAGNSTSTSVIGLNVDLTPPTNVAFAGSGLVDGGQYAYLFVPEGPTGCTALDATSGVATCDVTGYSALVGSQVIVGTATDVAGNAATATLGYEVLPWTLVGFGRPIDMTGLNTLRAGGSALLKFEVFAGSIELTSPDIVAGVDAVEIGCPVEQPAPAHGPGPRRPAGQAADAAGGGGHLAVRWESPDLPGTCWHVTLRTVDGSSLSADFRLR